MQLKLGIFGHHMMRTGNMLQQLSILPYILPICLCAHLTYNMKEGNNPNIYLGNIVSDAELMEKVKPKDYNLITFSLIQQSNSQLFHISEKTGKLYTAQIFDAESLCTYNVECYKIIEVAMKKASTVMEILEVKIIIEDINDHQPEFPNKLVNIELEEDVSVGTKISVPSATDKDVSVFNSKISYELKKMKNEPFILSAIQKVDGTSDLNIILKQRLDREQKDSYLIQVIAKDGGSPSKQNILDVHISVKDVNDNSPVFSQNLYNVTIKNEPSETSSIATLSAMDLDSGKNGRITYHFSTKTSEIARSHFKLNENTGQIFLKKRFILANELIHKLYVEAKDGGIPSLSSLAMILVTVINQQNNAPIIDVKFFSSSNKNTVNVFEDIKLASSIAYVKITDSDMKENGDVTCQLHHDKFQLQSLDTKKYQVIVKNTLDRETVDHHDIIIICQDKGAPSLQSESKFSVKVMDVNDEQPQFFKQTFKFFIHENQKSKFPVGYINATDPDLGSGGKLTYSLLPNNNEQFLPFKVADNGFISTLMSLDHDFQDIYQFKVLVKDDGEPSLNNTVNVIVEVRDENDNAPYFTFPSVNPYNLDVVYYPHHSKNITQIKASDSDSQENAFLKYEIIRGNSKQIFTINQYTGLLSSTHILSQQDAGSYELEFLVKDSGSPVLSARTTVYLMLTVSNKTSEMLNAVNIKKDNKIHLTSAIIIVSVAVTIAVIITASISVCILRCCNSQNTSYKKEKVSNRFSSDQKNLFSSPYLDNSWTMTNSRRNMRPKTDSYGGLVTAYKSLDRPHMVNIVKHYFRLLSDLIEITELF